MTDQDTDDTQLVETHSALVLLSGDRVLKWKKPLDLGFVDNRTLGAREHACQEEVRLNRRLSPDVYEGVGQLHDSEGRVQEHVVLMRRLPDTARLSLRVTTGGASDEDLQALARKVSAFHATCEPAVHGEAIAGPKRLRELWQIGLDALAEHAPGILETHTVSHARRLAMAYLDGRARLLQQRITDGLVRDGHGDLLADDVFLMPDGPRILDCLEFDESLRQGDVLSDVASLLADLERLGAPDAADVFLREYQRASGEEHPASLRHLYVAYRAQVRAKVACVRAGQTSSPAVRQEQGDLARRLTQIMVDHLESATVRMVLVGGLPGSGKSTLATGLGDEIGAVTLGTDSIRQRLLGATTSSSRYAAEQVQLVYEHLLAEARTLLGLGESVVLDASWSDAAERAAAGVIALETSSALSCLLCAVADETAAQRIKARGPDHESDATVEVRTGMTPHFAAWPEAVTIDCDRPIVESVQSALVVLARPAPRGHESSCTLVACTEHTQG